MWPCLTFCCNMIGLAVKQWSIMFFQCFCGHVTRAVCAIQTIFGSSSAGLFPVPKSLFLNTCSLDKIKNRVQASVTLAADFQSWDIDIGVISEMHLCRQKPASIVAIEGYTTYRMDGDWTGTDKKGKKGGVGVYVTGQIFIQVIFF